VRKSARAAPRGAPLTRSVRALKEREMMRAITLVLVLGLMVAPAYPKAKQGKSHMNVTLDNEGLKGRPIAVMSAWMMYGVARANWVSEHVLGKSSSVSGYHRSFEEELAGRESLAKIWPELKVSDKAAQDAYLDDLQSVLSAGFLREYIWFYLGSPEWHDVPDGLHLSDFEKWKSSNLVNHKVETLADVTIVEKPK
jgi:hypothetical protein